MELHHGDALLILDAHHGIRQPLGGIGLAHAGRALQNDVLLFAQQLNQRGIVLAAHEDIGEEVLRRIWATCCR